MDRRVKERLVGASILVVLIVLIVPELLSGPAPPAETPTLPVRAPEPIRNVTVDLRTSKAPAQELDAEAASSVQPSGARDDAASSATTTAMSAATIAAPSAAADTAPRSAAAAPSALATPPAATLQPSAPLETSLPPPTSKSTGSTPAAGGRGWAVQLGSFESHDNADKLSRQLKAQGFAVYVVPRGSGGSLRYRVRIGPMADHEGAAQVVAKLKSLGHPSSIVAPGA
jgi:cell division septation protein DedD